MKLTSVGSSAVLKNAVEWTTKNDSTQDTKHKNHVYVMGEVHTNTIESAFALLKRGIMSTWHRVSVKHLPAYLDEMCLTVRTLTFP